MKRILLTVLLLSLCFLLIACSTTSPEVSNSDSDVLQTQNDNISSDIPELTSDIYNSMRRIPFTFEDACKSANIVVAATYFKSERFGEGSIRHEFKVKETIFGDPEETVSVCMRDMDADINNREGVRGLYFPNISFEAGVDYLLLIEDQNDIYSVRLTNMLVCGVFINLDDLASSTMGVGDESIISQAKGIDFTKASREELISYVKDLTKDNTPAKRYLGIKSDKLEDIIKGSPNIVKIRIEGELTIVRTNYRESDNYDCTIVEVLKGELKRGTKYRVLFFPDTVKPGEEWLAALSTKAETSFLYLTSRNSLFACSQEKDLLNIINQVK